MRFICPACKQAKLEITKSIEFRADDNNDDVSFQTTDCSNCNFKGIAIYEENRRGSREKIHHYGYQVSTRAYNEAYSDIENNSVKNYDHYGNKHNHQNFLMEYKN